MTFDPNSALEGNRAPDEESSHPARPLTAKERKDLIAIGAAASILLGVIIVIAPAFLLEMVSHRRVVTDDGPQIETVQKAAIQKMRFYKHEKSGLCFGVLEIPGAKSTFTQVSCEEVKVLLR